MRDMLEKVALTGIVTAIMLLVILLQVTTPTTVGPLGILASFMLMYVSVLGILTFLLFGSSRIVSKISASLTVKKPFSSLTLRRSYYFSSVIALAPVMFIGMQSVGELRIYEVLLVILFVIIACIYISKRTS